MPDHTDERVQELDTDECVRYLKFGSWALAGAAHWIRITIDEISGRRIPEA